MNNFVRLPATDLPGVVGFVLMTVISIAIAKRVPVVKNLV